MTEEKIETTEEQTEAAAAETTPVKERLVESATALVNTVREQLIEWIRTGIDVTAKSVETGSEQLSVFATKLQDYAKSLPTAEKATNAEG